MKYTYYPFFYIAALNIYYIYVIIFSRSMVVLVFKFNLINNMFMPLAWLTNNSRVMVNTANNPEIWNQEFVMF